VVRAARAALAVLLAVLSVFVAGAGPHKFLGWP